MSLPSHITTFKELSEITEQALTQCEPMKLKVALYYCHLYIDTCQKHGATPFDSFVQRLHGFQPLEELMQKDHSEDHEPKETQS
jgi:hypothetical protein